MRVSFYSIAAYIGLLTIAYFCYRLFEFIQFLFHPSKLYRYIHNPNPNLKLDRQLSKPWALVTGSSDGIGKALAQQLCSRGFNIVLHGRSGAKLRKVKSDLESEFKADVRLLEMNASAKAIWANFDQTVLRVLDGINLTVVINNLGGFGDVSPIWKSIADHTQQEDEIVFDVNLRFMTNIIRVTLPILVKNSPGLILNVSSAVESMPMPWSGVYAGTKAYVKQYSHCLRVELQAEGKDVECVSVTPGKVVTEGAGRTPADESFDTPSAKGFAKAILDKVGYDSPTCTPYIGHKLGLMIFPSMPRTWAEQLMVKLIKEEYTKMYDSKKSK